MTICYDKTLSAPLRLLNSLRNIQLRSQKSLKINLHSLLLSRPFRRPSFLAVKPHKYMQITVSLTALCVLSPPDKFSPQCLGPHQNNRVFSHCNKYPNMNIQTPLFHLKIKFACKVPPAAAFKADIVH